MAPPFYVTIAKRGFLLAFKKSQEEKEEEGLKKLCRIHHAVPFLTDGLKLASLGLLLSNAKAISPLLPFSPSPAPSNSGPFI